jgi:Ni,Fe-hydrogenase III large subunit
MTELRSTEIAYPRQLASTVSELVGAGGRLMTLFVDPNESGGELVALVREGGEVNAVRVGLSDGTSYPSLTPEVPAAHWHEREIHDLHGIEPIGHPRLEPLLRTPNGERLPERAGEFEHRGHRRMGGAGVFVIPYGPVRSGVFETAEYLVQTSGEDVAYCAQRLFFKRRGGERRICEVPLGQAVLVAERISGTSSVAHALAFSQALEALAEAEVPERALSVRSVLAEIERIYNHLEVIVRECEDASLTVGQAQFAALKERLHRLAAETTGNRYLRGAIVPGGVKLNLDPDVAGHLRGELARWGDDYRAALGLLMETDSFLDRLISAGPLSEEDARDFGCVGPVARGSGIRTDTRRDLPYAAYAESPPEDQLGEDGDAMARVEVRTGEIADSLRLLDRLLGSLPAGQASIELPSLRTDEAVGVAESARGETVYYLRAAGPDRIGFCHIRAASFANFGIFNRLFKGQVLTDFAFIEHSLGLSPAGCDR